MSAVMDSETRTIGEVSRWISGGTPDRSNLEYWRGNIPWISAFTLKTTEISTSDQFITKEAAESGSKMAPIHSTLLLVRGSALHKEIRAGLVTAPVAFNQDVKALIPTGTIEPKYLTFAIQGNADRLLRLVTSAGNTAGVLDTKVVQDFEIHVPGKPDQQRIIAALSDVDTLVMTLQRLIAKKQAIKQGLMQQLLTGKTRLPGYSKPWGEAQIGNLIGKLKSGVSVKSIPGIGRYSVLKTSSVLSGSFNPDESKTVAPSDIERIKLSPARDTIIISRMNTPDLVGEVGYVSSDHPTLFLPDRLWLASAVNDKIVHMRWLSYILSSLTYSRRIKDKATGTSGSMKNIAQDALLSLTVVLPSKDEQISIADALLSADHEIEKLLQRRAKICAIKQGMMQELLTGRTRLQAAEVKA